MKNNILLTGASGFVGQNLISYLRIKDNQFCLLTRAELEAGDISRHSNCDVIVHLAGKAHDLEKTSNPSLYYDVNYELTKKLFNAFLTSNATRFIFISSVKAVTDAFEGVLTEDFPPNPKTDYGKSKLLAELYIKSQVLPSNKSYIILRPCMVHGPGNKGNLNLLYTFIERGWPYPFTKFNNLRSFLGVENLCFIIHILSSTNSASGTYNICDDEALSTNQVVSILATSLNKRTVKFWNINPIFMKILAYLGDFIPIPVNSEKLKKLTENYVVSNDKILALIGVSLPFSSRDSLQKTASSFIEIRKSN